MTELNLTKTEQETLRKLKPIIDKYSARAILQAIYLDFWNDYLSTDIYAEKNLLIKQQAESLLSLSKEVLFTEIDRVI